MKIQTGLLALASLEFANSGWLSLAHLTLQTRASLISLLYWSLQTQAGVISQSLLVKMRPSSSLFALWKLQSEAGLTCLSSVEVANTGWLEFRLDTNGFKLRLTWSLVDQWSLQTDQLYLPLLSGGCRLRPSRSLVGHWRLQIPASLISPCSLNVVNAGWPDFSLAIRGCKLRIILTCKLRLSYLYSLEVATWGRPDLPLLLEVANSSWPNLYYNHGFQSG